MRTILVAVALCLVGCGGSGSAFEGTFLGSLVTTGTCDDGTNATSSDELQLKVTSQAGSLLIDDGSACAAFTAAESGASASLNPKTCPDGFANGNTLHQSITGGTLSINGDVLSAEFDEAVDVRTSSGAAVRKCTATASGRLQRQ